MVEFNAKAVKELMDWVGGVAAGVAEELDLNGYAKKVVFKEFVASWILVSAHSGSGLREHARQFAAAYPPVSPLVPLPPPQRVAEPGSSAPRSPQSRGEARQEGGEKPLPLGRQPRGREARGLRHELAHLLLQVGRVGSPRSGGTKHRSFVKLLVRTIMSADGDGAVEHVAVGWDTRSFDDNAFLRGATSVREKDVTFIADEGFNALSGPKEVVRRETTSLYPTTATP